MFMMSKIVLDFKYFLVKCEEKIFRQLKIGGNNINKR